MGMRKVVILFLALTLLAAGAFAPGPSTASAPASGKADFMGYSLSELNDNAFDSRGELKPQYRLLVSEMNKQVDMVPGFIVGLFGNEKINLYITLYSGDELKAGVVTKNGKISSVTKDLLETPTMNVYSDEGTISEIANSKDPLTDFRKALGQGRIKYEGVGLVGSVKSGIVSVTLGVYGFLQALTGMASLFIFVK